MHFTQSKVTKTTGHWFDLAEQRWHSQQFTKLLSSVLIATYFIALILIEFKNNGIITWKVIPESHFKAIELAFTLLLFFEVISLVFTLIHSISKSVEIQLQILSLILLRDAFKIFGTFPNDYQISSLYEKVGYMFTDAFGALTIFAIIILIRKLDKHRTFFHEIDLQESFITAKKIIGLIMLVIFGVMIILEIYHFFNQEKTFNFFRLFFNFMTFTDILLVFISMRYSNAYRVLFRNSGFALATVIMRLALESAAPYNDILGIGSALFVLSLVFVYNRITVIKP